MLFSRRFGHRHAATSLLVAITAATALVGCQRLSPSMTPGTDLGSVTTATFVSAPSPFAQTSSVLPFEPLDSPLAVVSPESIWTAPPIESYAFESVNAAPAPAPAPVEAQPPAVSEPPAPKPDTGTLVESGIASTYGEGDGFQGNRTACGQRFDTNVPQVAHKTLPCGTMLRVEDTASGNSVVVEVTDRGPYVKGRVVDLSWAAFSQLHPKSPDLLNVNVYVLGKN